MSYLRIVGTMLVLLLVRIIITMVVVFVALAAATVVPVNGEGTGGLAGDPKTRISVEWRSGGGIADHYTLSGVDPHIPESVLPEPRSTDDLSTNAGIARERHEQRWRDTERRYGGGLAEPMRPDLPARESQEEIIRRLIRENHLPQIEDEGPRFRRADTPPEDWIKNEQRVLQEIRRIRLEEEIRRQHRMPPLYDEHLARNHFRGLYVRPEYRQIERIRQIMVIRMMQRVQQQQRMLIRR
jgi:hypothetical protein